MTHLNRLGSSINVPPGGTRLTIQAEGFGIPAIFDDAGNNARHYQDLKVPPESLTTPEPIFRDSRMIAMMIGRITPDAANVPLWTVNFAWPFVATVSGGSFGGLIRFSGSG